MVRLALLIMGLLSVFLLNACGSSNNSSNIDTKDAVFLQKGSFTGKPERVPLAEYTGKSKNSNIKQQPKIFNVDKSEIAVDWDAKKVVIKTELENDGKNKPEEIVLEGTFNDEGLAYLFPITESGKKVNAIAGVRCKDNKCEKLTIDMAAELADKNGEKKFREEQVDIVNPSPLKLEVPEVVKEVEPVSSGLQNTTAPAKEEVAPAVVKPPFLNAPQANVTPQQTAAEKKAAEKKLKEEKAAKEKQEKEYGEFTEPEGYIYKLPSILRPKEMVQKGPGLIKLADYSDSELFPFNLGEKYSGQARGNYSTECRKDKITKRVVCEGGFLSKGTGINVNVENQTTVLSKVLGFFSVSLNDKRFYGSGLLVKTIEEAGKLYTGFFPGEYFEVNDMSQAGGGRMKPHQSHQNGLDADIIIPKKSNGSNDYAKAWAILKSFVKLGYVDVVFLNPTRIKAMCNYLKASGEKDYSSIFNKLYPETGHTSHMHVRLQCTNHNSCNPKKLTPSKYAVCK